MSNIIITIANNRTAGLEMLVLLTGNEITNLDTTQIEINKPRKLSDIPGGKITLDTIESGRLYLIEADLSDLDIDQTTGTLQTALDPKSDLYYGWIEFSATADDISQGRIWSNLTNVDMVGLPLSLAGKLDSESWHLGIKASANDIRKTLKDNVLLPQSPPQASPAIIDCEQSREKVIAPNIVPEAFPSFETYIQELSNKEAEVVINTDFLSSRGWVEYRGSFKKTTGDFATSTEIILEMTTTDSFQDKIQITKKNLNDQIVKECDGGTLIFTPGGGSPETLPQNVQPADSKNPDADKDQRTLTNSAFRNILIGINEGYFEKDQINYSRNFPYLSPFIQGKGNPYAQVIFENTNSYGFPYADSNLKVLVTSSPQQELTLTTFDDDQVFGFSNEADLELFSNEPQTGDYEFGIGSDSESLGTIKIGSCRYVPNAAGAYGGAFPVLDDWTKMEFLGPDTFIWIKTPDPKLPNPGSQGVEASGCFQQQDSQGNWNDFTPTWIAGPPIKLTWGANIRWKPGQPSPAQPVGATAAVAVNSPT